MSDFTNVAKKEKESEIVSLNDMFKAYCRMDPISNSMNVELLPLSQCDKWLLSAKILDMNNITTTDIGLHFFKFRKRAINYEEFLEYIKNLADAKKLDLNDIKYKLQSCTVPVHLQGKKKK